jgi:hypothetical protein
MESFQKVPHSPGGASYILAHSPGFYIVGQKAAGPENTEKKPG